MWVWNGAHDDMFSKSSALPRHSFEEQPARREERKRDSVCECGRGSRREISRVFRRMILADWPICSAGASKFTQTARVVTPTAATEREREQEVPWHAAPVTWPLLAWSPSSHLFFFFFPSLLCLYPDCFRRCSLWFFPSSGCQRADVMLRSTCGLKVAFFNRVTAG